MSSFYGTRVTDKNVRLRIFITVFFGIIALASVLFWKEKELVASDYVEFTGPRHLRPNIDIDNN